MSKIVKIQAPDGSIVKIEGPDDASDDVFIQQGAALWEQNNKIKAAQAARFPTSAELGGKPGSIAPSPEHQGLFGKLKQLGEAVFLEPEGVSTGMDSYAVALAGAASPGGAVTKGMSLFDALKRGPAVAAAGEALDPSALMARANANRLAYAESAPLTDTVDLHKPLSALKVVNNATRPARAAAQEYAANKLARFSTPPSFANVPQTAPPSAPIAMPNAPRMAEVNPLDVGAKAAPSPSAPIPFQMPPEQPFEVYKPAVTGPRQEIPFRMPQEAPFEVYKTPVAGPRTEIPMANPPDLSDMPVRPPGGLTAADVNKWMGTSPKEVARGGNPGQQLLEENLLGANKTETQVNVAKALDNAGKTMEAHLKAATAKGVTIDAQTPVYDAVANAKKALGAPRTDAAFNAQMDGLVDDIEGRFPGLDKLTPEATHELKVWVGDAIQWNGAGYDTPVNKALVSIYRDLNGAIKGGVEGIGPAQTRWGNLYIASRNLKGAIAKEIVGKGTGNAPTAAAKTLFDRMKAH